MRFLKRGVLRPLTPPDRLSGCRYYLIELLFLLFVNHPLYCLDPNKRVTQYDIRVYQAKDGLPASAAKDVFQDSKGYIWIAGQEGLVRFDGIRFVRLDKSNHPGLREDFIWDIEEDNEGNLWLGTNGGGVSVFDGKSFRTFDTSDGLTSNVMEFVVRGKDGAMWLGTERGLCRFYNGLFSRVPGVTQRSPNTDVTVTALFVASTGLVYVADSEGGLMTIDPTNMEKTTFRLPRKLHSFCELASGEVIAGGSGGTLFMIGKDGFRSFDPPDVSSKVGIHGICEDRHGNLWLCTNGDGVFRLSEGRMENLRSSYVSVIRSDFFYRAIEDREGSLWFVSDGGIYRFCDNRFVTYGKMEGFPGEYATTICEDSDGRIWTGFRDGGIGVIQRDGSVVESEVLQDREVNAIFTTNDESLWIGTPNGVYLYRPPIGNWFEGVVDREDIGVMSFHEGHDGMLWMGRSNGWVYKYDGKDLTLFGITPHHGSSDVVSLLERSNGQVLAGTRKSGLYMLGDSLFEALIYDQRFPRDGVNAIYEDSNQVLWVATDGHGLYRQKDGVFRNITSGEGLAFDRLFTLLEDNHGSFWMSGNQGIFSVRKDDVNRVLDGESARVNSTLYNYLDGMREAECNGRKQPIAWKSRDGRLWFCGIAGVLSIDPANIPRNTVVPPVHIEEIISTNNRRMCVEDRLIRLASDERNLEIAYTAPSFVVPERVMFKYRLYPYDDDWVDAGGRRRAFYTNLPKGDYRFHVIACNNDGVWNTTGASIEFTIAPYWYETWWAYSLYGVVLGVVILGIRSYEMKRLKLRNDLTLQQVEARRLEELDRVKSRFFANISHEFRTPLTLILGPLADIRAGKVRGDLKNEYGIMERNARRLLRLINELLDLSELEAGKMKLHAIEGDLVAFIRGVASAFESLARHKEIRCSVLCDVDSVAAYFDPEKLEKVLTNLISNAFKFTPAGGDVTVQVSIEPLASAGEVGIVALSVRNTGPGIPADQLEHVFERFYHNSIAHDDETVGSGIGLSLAKELVELHHGQISVRSEVGRETEFTIRLPLGKNHLGKENLAESRGISSLNARIVEDSVPGEPGNEERGYGPREYPSILIVEDNADMREYLKNILSGAYRIAEAIDGRQGIEEAIQHGPDLIVSDVMMPNMDGFEFCRKVKQDERTSHIPVILLTARAGGESKLEGLDTGADDYLTKPFDGKELLARIRNLIEQRKKLREKFKQQIILQPQEIAVTSADQKFLQAAMEFLERNMADPELTVERFADGLGMSRMNVHRKLSALTGQSAGQFILSMRLKRAAQLLQKKAGTVSEIAFQVGFNHLSYFSKRFKEHFGKLPSEYAEEGTRNSSAESQ